MSDEIKMPEMDNEIKEVVYVTHPDKDLGELLKLFNDKHELFKEGLKDLFYMKSSGGFDTLEKLEDYDENSMQRVKDRINASYPNALS